MDTEGQVYADLDGHASAEDRQRYIDAQDEMDRARDVRAEILEAHEVAKRELHEQLKRLDDNGGPTP